MQSFVSRILVSLSCCAAAMLAMANPVEAGHRGRRCCYPTVCHSCCYVPPCHPCHTDCCRPCPPPCCCPPGPDREICDPMVSVLIHCGVHFHATAKCRGEITAIEVDLYPCSLPRLISGECRPDGKVEYLITYEPNARVVRVSSRFVTCACPNPPFVAETSVPF